MKESKPLQVPGRRPIRGEVVHAAYQSPELEDYSGNSLIEALPLIWNWEDDMVLEKLNHYSAVSESQRNLPAYLRLHSLGSLRRFFQVLRRHRYLEQNLSLLIRDGYVGRNPLRPTHRRDLHDRIEALKVSWCDIATASNLGFALLGSPGMGKTTSIERILKLYPQVIEHKRYIGQDFPHTQIVWLVLTCPHDGSTRGLCLSFFSELDSVLKNTHYYEDNARGNEDSMIAAMAALAAVLSLGVLVIDEIQFLSAAKSGGKHGLLKFFVQLQNELGIPVILIGTNRASGIIAGSFHQARRSVGGGGDTWEPLTFDDPEWELFLDALWRNQYLKQFVPRTPELTAAMYEETQGILDAAVKLFFFVQKDSINEETEMITVESLRRAAQKYMKYIRPYVLALRRKDKERSEALEDALSDIVSPDFEDDYGFFSKQYPLPARVSASDRQCRSDTQLQCPPEAASPVDAPIPPFQTLSSAPAVSEVPTPPLQAKKKTRQKRAHPEGSIMAICAEAREKENLTPYAALAAAGSIRNAGEFLPVVAS